MRGSRTGLQSLNRLGHGTIGLSTAGADQPQQQRERSPEGTRRRVVRIITDRSSHQELLILAACGEVRQPSTRGPIAGRKHYEGRKVVSSNQGLSLGTLAWRRLGSCCSCRGLFLAFHLRQTLLQRGHQIDNRSNLLR